MIEVILQGMPSIDVNIEAKVIDSYKQADSSLSTTSTNPVMNKIVTEELNKKAVKEEVTAALNSKADNEEVNAKLTELSEEINGNLIQEINLTQGVGLNPNSKKFPLRIGKGDVFIRLIDDNNIISKSEVTFFAYDAQGTAILSDSSVTKNGVTRTLNADAESFGLYILSSDVISSGEIQLEIISKYSNYGIKDEIESLRTISIKPDFNGFVFSKIDGGFLSLNTSSGYSSEYFPIEDVISIYYKGSTYGNIGAVIFYDANKHFISAITSTSAIGTIVSDFPDSARYARFSFVPNAQVEITYKADSANNRLATIDELLKETSIKTIPLEVGIDSSYIYYSDGQVVSATTMAISKEIDVKGGDLLTIGAASTTNAAAIAIKKNGEYFPLLRGNASPLQDTYTISEDCKIVVSFVKSTLTTNSIRILSNARISELYEHFKMNTTEMQERDSDFVAFTNGRHWRCVVDFNITTNVNKSGADIVIAKFGNTPIVAINQASPSILSTRYADDEPSYVAELQYNSGYTIADKKYILEQKKYKPLVGSPAISLWLKGLTLTSEPSESEVVERATWLENNQDYSIVFENNIFSIIKDGIAYDGSVFNGGKTETIFSTSVANKTMASFYNELKALDYLEVEMMNMIPSASCEELLQFGKVKLVGRYYQQKNRGSSAKEYLFDSFPFLLRYAKDTTSHVLEMVNDGENTYIAIDGLFAKTATLPEVISIQKSSSISIDNVSWKSGAIDGVVLHDDYLISDKTSRIVGFMGHSVKDTYEGGGLINDSVTSSVTRLENICSLLKEKNYNVLNLDEINSIMSQSMAQLPSMRNAFFVFDDERIKEIYLNPKIRNHVARYGYPMNFAVIHDRNEFTQAEKDSVLPMRLNGWCCASHSLLHDVALPNKNSLILRWELNEIRKRCDTYYFVPNVLVYNWSGDWEPLYNMLTLCGYVAAINSGGDYTIKASNPYNMGRINIADITPFKNIKDLVA